MKYVSKKFLNNSAEETGSIAIHAYTPESDEPLNGWVCVDAGIQIRDCNNQVSLDFNLDNERGFQNRVEKLEVLIEELIKFRDILPIIYRDLVNRKGEENEDSRKAVPFEIVNVPENQR